MPIVINLGALWACQNLWGHGMMILVKFGARDMTLFVFYVDPHFHNFGYFNVYGGTERCIYRYLGVHESL